MHLRVTNTHVVKKNDQGMTCLLKYDLHQKSLFRWAIYTSQANMKFDWVLGTIVCKNSVRSKLAWGAGGYVALFLFFPIANSVKTSFLFPPVFDLICISKRCSFSNILTTYNGIYFQVHC